MAEEQTLTSRRSRRSTAGNRMEQALAEFTLEEPQDLEDVDFADFKEEEDVFESDFASTDEEAAQEDVDEGDKVAREEERRERKTVRTRIEKATAAAHARQRVTFNPEAATPRPKSKLAQKPKRRVSLGVAVNAETGEVIEGGTGTVGVKRQSQRRHTVLNTSATVNRIKDAEEKRAAIPKKAKMATRLPTQDELIARALDTEEGNITEHRDYLRLEEEKRAKARVVKQSIVGPVLRWVSKKETIQVEVQLPPPPALSPTTSTDLYAARYNYVYTSGLGTSTVGSQAYSMPFYAYTPFTAQNSASKSQGATVSTTASSSGPSTVHSIPLPSTSSQNVKSTTALATSVIPSTTLSVPSQLQSQPQPQTQTQIQSQSPSPILLSYPHVPTAPLITHRNEVVCKNYVIHELSQSIPSNPSWKDTMSAMFGDHVQWDQVKVFTGKGRPMSRPVATCLITGQPAKYRDPRTNAPFANVAAYNVLTSVLGRGYVWSSALGCYVSEMSRKSECRGPEEAGAGAGAGAGAEAVEGVVGEHEAEESEERIPKRRKVGTADKR